MSTIFITGISGFLGRNLEVCFSKNGHVVVGTSFKSTADKHMQCDIRDSALVHKIIEQIKPDIIIHAAALSSVTEGKTIEYYDHNVLGTENVINATKALKKRVRFIFISTAGVYGNQQNSILSENLEPFPVSHYGLSKLVCEKLIMAETGALDVSIIRPFNIVGIGQKSGFIFPKLVKHFKERSKTIQLGNLSPVRDYIDIYSACDIIKDLTFSSNSIGHIVNLCSGHGTSVQQLLDIFSEITCHKIEVVANAALSRRSEVWALLGDTTKLQSLLPELKIAHSLKSVIQEMLSSPL